MTNHPPPPLQLLDGPHNPHPHPPAVEVAWVRKLVGAPEVDVGDHQGIILSLRNRAAFGRCTVG